MNCRAVAQNETDKKQASRENPEISCTVVDPGTCNYATKAQNNATSHATDLQPKSLKALANKILNRNQQCNQDATGDERLCNQDATKAGNHATSSFESLLNKVGAYVRTDSEGTSLVFDPPLAGPWHDAERWELAGYVEAMFFRGNMPATICSKKPFKRSTAG